MDRRHFFAGATSSSLLLATSFPGMALAQGRVRSIKSEIDGVPRRWRHAVINDPTGSAPARRVERFELRNGDCHGGDCNPNPGPRGPQTRARVERHTITDLADGEQGQFVMSIYFPSREYNFLQGVMTATGQLYLYDRPSNDWDGGPLWMIESDPGSENLFVKISRFYIEGGRLQSDTLKRYSIGKLGSSIPMDRWVQVVVNFRLSSANDGSVETYVGGRKAMTYRGPTSYPGAVLGHSYGIYQVRTNQYPGGADAIPPQVVYYAGIGIART